MTSNEQLIAKLKDSGALTHPLYEQAFRRIERHVFLPNHPLDQVYADEAVGIKLDEHGFMISSSSQPSMMLLMFGQMELDHGQKVLEIGAGTGYNAAMMQAVVGKDGHVTTIELDEDVYLQAQANLNTAGMSKVTVLHADGADGYPENAPYDRILGTVGIWDVPRAWVRQLASDGRIITPIQLDGFQVSACFKLQADGTLISENYLPCRFVYLRGSASAPELTRRIGSTDLRLISAQLDKIDLVSLQMLLSSDQELCQLARVIDNADFWLKFVPYAVLNNPKDSLFSIFYIDDKQKAYGMEGVGVALLTPGSASFLPYGSIGQTYCFAGSDAFVEFDQVVVKWFESGKLGIQQLRLKLIPKELGRPASVAHGVIYDRYDHYLHAWLEPI